MHVVGLFNTYLPLTVMVFVINVKWFTESEGLLFRARPVVCMSQREDVDLLDVDVVLVGQGVGVKTTALVHNTQTLTALSIYK